MSFFHNARSPRYGYTEVTSHWDLLDAMRIARKVSGGRRVENYLSLKLGELRYGRSARGTWVKLYITVPNCSARGERPQ